MEKFDLIGFCTRKKVIFSVQAHPFWNGHEYVHVTKKMRTEAVDIFAQRIKKSSMQ
ncbi:hypothetical protein RU97_GL000018 [Enterococcus canis]|uniref:Uncharacterized protein n=1 Tax=Enterococcus canis TaxID=214095 RepID=A0A1L8RJ99_9ENTE|nr:hypothetical protein RU97_GL000018 [Enterococcus canis]